MAVIIVMAAAFAFGGATSAGQTKDPIDLTAQVEASNCAPCHARIATARKPGLVFEHGNHLLVSCSACHYRAAHEDGKTYSPPMESCFNCHGIQHGPQGELATSECRDCHTPSFKLRPRSHVKDWAGGPHAERGKLGVNACMLCHDGPEDCDACHKAEKVDVGQMPKGYETVLAPKLERPSIKVYPDQPTSMGQCIYCHPDIDDFVPGTVIFEHAEHIRRNYQCTVCHPKFGHDIDGARRPDMLSCYRCHGLTHAASGLVATEECGACHPKDFELKPSDHTSKFEEGAHGKRADAEGAYCAMCHQPDFCVECHMGRKVGPDGERSRKVIPADHRKAEWMSKHGGLFLTQKGSCASCHDSPSCKSCHVTVMPHPADWVRGHAENKDELEGDCNVCHTDREKCQSCHHDTVKRAELIEKNCVPCHEEMKKRPATSIKHKGFAEHAVHFKVEEVKGKPYKCYECHVGFGTNGNGNGVHSASLRDAAHDLRLCYDCHGTLDYKNVLIAPYRGAELCRRCHTDLNI
ncbi:MAG: hypothetical protein IBX62_04520 [Coriobacteriia bacterium]|nr:hypothetical protein [Coriobacteriia bacterium]